jgi:hypothetical protein
MSRHDLQAVVTSGRACPSQIPVGPPPESLSAELRFADGSHTSIKPTDGFILYALTRSQNARGGLTEAIAHNAAGKEVGHETFKPTRR